MVAISQYQQQLQQRRTSLEQAKSRVVTQQRTFTQQQLRALSPLQRQQQLRTFEEAKQKQLELFKPEFAKQTEMEKEIQTYQQQLQQVQAEQAEWKSAQEWIKRGQESQVLQFGQEGIKQKVRELLEKGFRGPEEVAKQEAQAKRLQEAIEGTIAMGVPISALKLEPALEKAIITRLSVDLGFKNVFTGEIILESMSPEIARKRGLIAIPIDFGGKEIKMDFKEQLEFSANYPEYYKVPEIPSLYQRAEEKVSKKLLEFEPIKYVYEKAEPFAEVIAKKGIFRAPLEFRETEEARERAEFVKGFIVSAIREPIKKPIFTTAMVGLGYGIGKIAPPVISYLGKTALGAKVIVPAIKYIPPIAYVGMKSYEVYEAPTYYEKGEVVGKAITTEIIPIYAGAKLAQYDKVLFNKFITQQKVLFKDISAKAGTGKKVKTQKQIVYTRKFKSDVNLKDALDVTIQKGTKKDVIILSKRVLGAIERSSLSKADKIKAANNWFDLLSDYGFSRTYIIQNQKLDEIIKSLGLMAREEIITIPIIKTTGAIIEPTVIKPSVFTGLGLYERYAPSESIFFEPRVVGPPSKLGEVNIFWGVAPTGKIAGLITGKIGDLGVMETRFKTGLGLGTAVLSASELATRQRAEQDSWHRTLQKGRLRARERARVGLGIGLGIAAALTTAQRAALRQRAIIRQRYDRRYPRPRIPFKPEIPVWYFPEGKVREKELKELLKRRREGLFVPYVKRYGRFIPVGKPVTFRRAKIKGISVLRRTLAATLEIRRAKTGEPVPIAKVTRRFRPRRGRDVFGLVQRAPFRLRAPTEVREIISARKGVKFI